MKFLKDRKGKKKQASESDIQLQNKIDDLLRECDLDEKIIKEFKGKTVECGVAFCNAAAYFLSLALAPIATEQREVDLTKGVFDQARRMKKAREEAMDEEE